VWKLAFFVYACDIILVMDRLLIEFINDWAQFHGTWNWYTFTLINIEFENDVMCHGYEFYFVILGLGFRIRYNKASFKPWVEEIERDVKNSVSLEDLKKELL
jgi:hypothetical protein